VSLTCPSSASGAPGSTLHVEVRPAIAVDAGSAWTAITVRIGAEALDAVTLGLVDADGEPLTPKLRKLKGEALREFWRAYLDDHEALRHSRDRVLDHIDRLWGCHLDAARRYGADGFMVAVETSSVPKRGNRGSRSRIPLRDTLLPREIAAAVSGCIRDSVLVLPRCHGGRHLAGNGGTGNPRDYYPRELFGSRPPTWGPNEHPRQIRDHEQAAFVVAAEAELLVRAGVRASRENS
jgi:hypothetical protein